MDMLQDCLDIFASGLGQVIANMAIALLCGFLVSLLYRRTYQGPGYSTTFVSSIAPLSMITALVIMVIGNNLARAFGLVGALSIIRFRTAIKDTQDIVFIFFALAVGMAAGVGLPLSAVVGTLFIGLGIFVSRANCAFPRRHNHLLWLSLSVSEEEEELYLPLLEKHCKQYKLINMKSIKNGDLVKLSFYVYLKDQAKSRQLVQELGRVAGVSRVNLFFDKEPF